MKIYLDQLSIEILEQLENDPNLVSVLLVTNSKDKAFWLSRKDCLVLLDQLFAILENKQHLFQVTIVTSNFCYLYPEILQKKIERLTVRNASIRSYAVTTGSNFDYVAGSHEHQPIIDKIIASNSDLHEPTLRHSSNSLIHKIHLQDCIEEAAIILNDAPQTPSICRVRKCVDALQGSIDNIDTLTIVHELNQLLLKLTDQTEIFEKIYPCVYQLKSALVKYRACHKQFEYECFLSNSSVLTKIWALDKNPHTYAKLCHASALAGARFIKNTKHPKALDLYYFLANLRHEIAMNLKQQDKQVIGKKRDFYAGETPIIASENSRYSDYAIDLRARLHKLMAHDPDKAMLHGFQILPLGVIDGFDLEADTGVVTPRISRTTNSVQVIKDGIPLSRICLKHYGEGEGIFQVKVDYNSKLWPHIKDTDPRFFSELFSKIEALFSEFMQDTSPTYKNALLIGKMAWYYAHIMPCVRGSAATTELFAYTLFITTGFPLLPYTSPITMDLEAIFEPDIEKFAANFANEFFLDLKIHYRDAMSSEFETSQESPYKKPHMMFHATDETNDTEDRATFNLKF